MSMILAFLKSAAKESAENSRRAKHTRLAVMMMSTKDRGAAYLASRSEFVTPSRNIPRRALPQARVYTFLLMLMHAKLDARRRPRACGGSVPPQFHIAGSYTEAL